MKSRALLILSAAVLLSFAAPSSLAYEDLQSELASIEKSLWEGWKNHDAKPFEEYLADEVVNISGGGMTTGKAALIQDITSGACDVRSYSLSDWTLHRLGRDAAMLVYKASQDATCDGEKVPASVYVSATYVKQGGKWKSASYHESPVAGE